MLGVASSLLQYAIGSKVTGVATKWVARNSVRLASKAVRSMGQRAHSAYRALRTGGADLRKVFSPKFVPTSSDISFANRSTAKLRLLGKRIEKDSLGSFIDKFTKTQVKKLNFGPRGTRFLAHTISGEAKALPFNYLYYRYEKYKGNVDKDENFLKFQASMMPFGIALNGGMGRIGRGLRNARRLSAPSGGGLALSVATRSAHAIRNDLSNRTRTGRQFLRHMVTRYEDFAPRTGIARGTIGFLKAMKDGMSNLKHFKGRDAMDSDITHRAIRSLNDSGLRRKRFEQSDSLLTDSSLIKHYNRSIRTANRKYLKAMGKSHNQEVIEAGQWGHQRRMIDGNSVVSSREMYTMGSSSYDVDFLHTDRIIDSTGKFLTKTLSVMGRKWLGYLDGEKGLLTSRKTRIMGLVKGGSFGTPGNIGKTPGAAIVTAGIGEMPGIMPYDMETLRGARNAAVKVFQEQFNVDKRTAFKAVKSKVTSTENWMEEMNLLDKKESLGDFRKRFYENYVGNAKHGVYELSPNETVHAFGGMLQTTLNVGTTKGGVGKYMEFNFHYRNSVNGALKPLEANYAIKGSTRAGQAVLRVLGSTEYLDARGKKNRVGGPSNALTSIEKYYHNPGTVPSTMGKKIADFFEIGGGDDSSIFSALKSVFTKFGKGNEEYAGNLSFRVAKNGKRHLTQKNLEDLFKPVTEERPGGPLRGRLRRQQSISKAAGDMSTHVVHDLHHGLRALQSSGESDYATILNKFVGFRSEGILKEQDFHNWVPSNKDTVEEVLSKLNNFSEFASARKPFMDKMNFNEDSLLVLKQTLYSSKEKSAMDAVYGTAKERKGTDLDRYTRSLFELASTYVGEAGSAESKAGSSYLASMFGRAKELGYKLPRGANLQDADLVHSALTVKRLTPKMRSDGEAVHRDAIEYASNIHLLATKYDESYMSSMLNKFTTFIRKGRNKEAIGAENYTIIVPKDKGLTGPTMVNVHHTVDGSIGKTSTTPLPIRSVLTMESVGTMNSALGFVGLGMNINKITSMGDIIQKMLLKRVLPGAAFMAANDIFSTFAQNTPGLKDTFLAGGITGVAMDAYAGLRVTSQYISDYSGITTVAKAAEDLMPGSISSPLSGLVRGVAPALLGLHLGYKFGRVGPVKGGLIGGAVGILLGGGPLGMFGEWSIDKGREEVIDELSGKKNVAVSSARWWELSGGSFLGEKISYFRPSMYFLNKKNYKNADNYLTDDLATKLTSYVDPSVYAREHQYSRPYLESGGIGTNIPIIGFAAQIIPGNTHTYHEDYMDQIKKETLKTTADTDSTYFYGGEMHGGSETYQSQAYSSGSLESVLSRTADNVGDIAGLRGFLATSALAGITGSASIISGGVHIQSANRIGSIARQYWDMALGGLIGASEGVRRIIPNEMKENEVYNPIPNAMPMYLPGSQSFIDYLHGDPFQKLEMGEVRLPGNGFELTHDVFYTYPIDGIMLGKSIEEQAAYYSGDIMYMSQMRRNWDLVERTRKEIIGNMRKVATVVKEQDVAYNSENDVSAFVDAVIEDPQGGLVAVKVAPMLDAKGGQGTDAGAVGELNAYLNMVKLKGDDTMKGLLVTLDKDGNMKRMYVNKDIQKFEQDIKTARQSVEIARNITVDLQREGTPINRSAAYSHLNRLQILVDAAPFSKEAQLELKIVKTQVEEGMLGKRGGDIYAQIMTEYGKRMNSMSRGEYRFIPYIMGKTPLGSEAIRKMKEVEENYSPISRYIGAGYEFLSHLRNPITNKLVGQKSSYELWREKHATGLGFKCLTKDVPIYSDGKVITIENIQVGQLVLTHKGRYRKVLKVNKRKTDNNDQIFEVYTKGNGQIGSNAFNAYPLRITGNHYVLVKRKGIQEEPIFKRLDEIDIKTECLLFPRINNEQNFYKRTICPVPKYSKNTYLVNNNKVYILEGMGTQSSIKVVPKQTAIKSVVNIDSDFYFFLGLYLAEGSCLKNGISIDLNIKEIDLAIKLKESIRNCFGVETQDIVKLTQRVRKVVILSKCLSEWVKETFGTEKNKHIPPVYIPREFEDRIALLESFTEGDGTIGETYLSAGNVCKHNIIAMKIIMHCLGITPSMAVNLSKPYSIEERTGITNESVHYIIKGNAYKRWKEIISKKSIGNYKYHYHEVEINSIIRIEYNDYLYDLTVEEDHSYTTWHCCVHNSWQNPYTFIGPNLELLNTEEDPIQAGISGATAGYMFFGGIGATIMSAYASLKSATGLSNNQRTDRLKEIDQIYASVDMMKYLQLDEMAQQGDKSASRRIGRTVSSALTGAKEAGYYKVVGGVSPAERGYVKNVMNNLYKEDIENVAALLPSNVQPIFQSAYSGMKVTPTAYQGDVTKIKRSLEGVPLNFRVQDVAYRTMSDQGYDAHMIGLGYYQQANRIDRMERSGTNIPILAPIQ